MNPEPMKGETEATHFTSLSLYVWSAYTWPQNISGLPADEAHGERGLAGSTQVHSQYLLEPLLPFFWI
jgi:hypothetical protein